jgi:hypothetical protein
MMYYRSPYRHFRTENPYGPVKVSMAITKLEDGRGMGITIRTQCLSYHDIDGWDLVKTLNGQHLYRMDVHYSIDTFMAIIELFSQFINEAKDGLCKTV